MYLSRFGSLPLVFVIWYYHHDSLLTHERGPSWQSLNLEVTGTYTSVFHQYSEGICVENRNSYFKKVQKWIPLSTMTRDDFFWSLKQSFYLSHRRRTDAFPTPDNRVIRLTEPTGHWSFRSPHGTLAPVIYPLTSISWIPFLTQGYFLVKIVTGISKKKGRVEKRSRRGTDIHPMTKRNLKRTWLQ